MNIKLHLNSMNVWRMTVEKKQRKREVEEYMEENITEKLRLAIKEELTKD